MENNKKLKHEHNDLDNDELKDGCSNLCNENTKQKDKDLEQEKYDHKLEKITELEEENSNLKDLYLRKQAEFDNFRKRLEKEKMTAVKFANEDIMKDVVNFLDNLRRAIESSKESNDFGNLLQGIALIEQEIVSSFEKKHSLKNFGEVNDDFDPTKHEAISIKEENGIQTPKIIEIYQKGYTYNERILRTAKVKVIQEKNN